MGPVRGLRSCWRSRPKPMNEQTKATRCAFFTESHKRAKSCPHPGSTYTGLDPCDFLPCHARLMAMNADITRFMGLADVADVLNISVSQVYALVRRGELRAIKVGGKGQWRVENAELERYIEGAYEVADEFIREHPFAELAESSEGDLNDPATY